MRRLFPYKETAAQIKPVQEVARPTCPTHALVGQRGRRGAVGGPAHLPYACPRGLEGAPWAGWFDLCGGCFLIKKQPHKSSPFRKWPGPPALRMPSSGRGGAVEQWVARPTCPTHGLVGQRGRRGAGGGPLHLPYAWPPGHARGPTCPTHALLGQRGLRGQGGLICAAAVFLIKTAALIKPVQGVARPTCPKHALVG